MTNNNELLEAAAELIVTLRSWGLHHTGVLLTRNADTLKPVGGWAGERLEAEVLRVRAGATQGEDSLKEIREDMKRR
jgi:hypothetical protein